MPSFLAKSDKNSKLSEGLLNALISLAFCNLISIFIRLLLTDLTKWFGIAFSSADKVFTGKGKPLVLLQKSNDLTWAKQIQFNWDPKGFGFEINSKFWPYLSHNPASLTSNQFISRIQQKGTSFCNTLWQTFATYNIDFVMVQSRDWLRSPFLPLLFLQILTTSQ